MWKYEEQDIFKFLFKLIQKQIKKRFYGLNFCCELNMEKLNDTEYYSGILLS